MTRKRLFNFVIATITFYVSCILFGISARILLSGDVVYATFKDIIPFLIAIPAAWLGYCFSRRLAFLQQIRALWSIINQSVQAATQYTHLTNPKQEQFREVICLLSTAIDEVRGVFKNIGERSDQRGLYPFEELKLIKGLVSNLGFGETYHYDESIKTRRLIVENWKKVQGPFLREFDREEPTYPSTPFKRDVSNSIDMLK